MSYEHVAQISSTDTISAPADCRDIIRKLTAIVKMRAAHFSPSLIIVESQFNDLGVEQKTYSRLLEFGSPSHDKLESLCRPEKPVFQSISNSTNFEWR